MLAMFAALANPHRLRVLSRLHGLGRAHVSGLAREAGISRPLMLLHLRKLEAAGLVVGRRELSDDGKALNVFEIVPFDVSITPATLAAAAATLT